MTTTESEIEAVARPLIDEATLDRLMARVESEGLEVLGPDGVLTELTSRIMNRAMEAEMSEHLGYDHGDPAGHGSGNNRNGTSAKTVLTDAGAVVRTFPGTTPDTVDVSWDLTDAAGLPVPPGRYMLRLTGTSADGDTALPWTSVVSSSM